MNRTLESLIDVLGSIPPLPGAACRGRPNVFDPPEGRVDPDDEQARRDRAVTICRNECPAFAGCAAWLANLEARDRPHGVVAGQWIEPPNRVVLSTAQAAAAEREQRERRAAAATERATRPKRPPNPIREEIIAPATAWLTDYLAVRGGSAPRADVMKSARAARISVRTLYAAVGRAQVVSARTHGRAHTWQLPTTTAEGETA